MRISIACAFMVVVQVAVAWAQPGMTQPPPGPPPPPPQNQVRLVLTSDEADLLETGDISDVQHIGGGFASLFMGLGVGQAIQGRWSETGWMFTLGEGASVTLLTIGLVQQLEACPLFSDTSCHSDKGDNLMIAGLIGVVGFRVWEIVDAFAGPPIHNRKLHELRMRLGLSGQVARRVQPYAAPGSHGGGVFGVALSF